MDIPKFHKGGILKSDAAYPNEFEVVLLTPRVLVKKSELDELGVSGVRAKYGSPNAEIVSVADTVYDKASPSEKIRLLQE